MNLSRLVAALAALSCCTPALADNFNTTQGGSDSAGAVVQRRQGTSGKAAVPVDEGNPLPVTGSVAASASAAITNPAAVLTRPANTTNYAQNNLVASSTTAGSVSVPSVAIANAAGGALIPRLRLATNKAAGWDTAVIRVRLWSAAPTYTNGDGGAYAVATGAAGFLAQFDVTLSQFGDGAIGAGAPGVGTAAAIKLASGTAIFWDLQYTGSAALTPASGQTFTLTAEVLN